MAIVRTTRELPEIAAYAASIILRGIDGLYFFTKRTVDFQFVAVDSFDLIHPGDVWNYNDKSWFLFYHNYDYLCFMPDTPEGREHYEHIKVVVIHARKHNYNRAYPGDWLDIPSGK